MDRHILRQYGRELFHMNEVTGLAQALGIHRRTMHFYLDGGRPVPDWMAGKLRAYALGRVDLCRRIAAELERSMREAGAEKPATPAPRPRPHLAPVPASPRPIPAEVVAEEDGEAERYAVAASEAGFDDDGYDPARDAMAEPDADEWEDDV